MGTANYAAAALIATYPIARQYLSNANLIYGSLTITWLFYLAFMIFIYPFYFSPFRHLSEPDSSWTARFPWYHAAALRGEDFHADAFRAWTDHVPNTGIIRFRVLFNQERLLLTSPEALKEVLVTKNYEFEKPPEAGYLFRQVLGNGVLVAEGDVHKHQRRSLIPAFAFRHIKDLYPLFWKKARESTEEIIKASAGKPTPQLAYDWAGRTTLDIIGQAGIGFNFNSIADPDGPVVSTYRKLFGNDEPPGFRWIGLGIFIPMQLLIKLPIPSLEDAKRASAAIRAFAHDIVQSRRSALKSGEEVDIDIMSVAMRSGTFTDEEVVDQMMTFLAAGHETTASSLTWAVWLLCKHQDVQDRLRDEIRANLPSTHEDFSAAGHALQIDKLPYLNAVISEVFRFIPTVPFTVRDAAIDTTILDQKIPKGTRMFISPWATNVNPNLWGESAEDFNPDRWITNGVANASGGATNNFANLGFLHGPRSCIGKDFARSEFLCILAAWVGRFRLKPAGQALPMQAKGWVTSHPKHKMPVIFEEVPGW